MTSNCEAPARAADAGTGAGCSLPSRENSPNPKKASPKNQAKRQPADPIVVATNWRLTADLLGEVIEIANAYGLGVMRAVRECDDGAILAQFQGFDAATGTARQCAAELRRAVNLLEGGAS